jgi:hypothetical protein
MNIVEMVRDHYVYIMEKPITKYFLITTSIIVLIFALYPPSSMIFQKITFSSTFYLGTILPELLTISSSTRQLNHWNEIIDGLFLGALPIETEFLSLGNDGVKIMNECKIKNRTLGLVTSVMNQFEFNGEGLIFLKPISREFWESKNVEHLLKPMDDFGGNIQIEEIKETVDRWKVIIDQGKCVYVHCKAGKGRSFTFLAAYLLLNTDLSLQQIFNLIKRQRPQISPNLSQYKTLHWFRKAYSQDKSMGFVIPTFHNDPTETQILYSYMGIIFICSICLGSFIAGIIYRMM